MDTTIINRQEAIKILSKADFNMLTQKQRKEILLDWWSIDESDIFFWELSESLRKELLQSEEPLYEINNSRYDDLVLIGLRYGYIGVKNEYLSQRLTTTYNTRIIVEGDVEVLFACPCCHYKTLEERGGYFICKVCWWEDNGGNDPLVYSSPNHMTLAMGRDNFEKYGNVDACEVTHNEMKDRYEYDHND